MNTKKTFVCCFVLGALCMMPEVVLGYGEGYNDEVPLPARQQLLLVNEVRCDPQALLRECEASICLERDCYQDALTPLYWDDNMSRAAQLHAQMMVYLDEDNNKLYTNYFDPYYGHTSPCKLVSDIGSTFQSTCDGHPVCACEGGNWAASKDDGSDTFERLEYFGVGGSGENISAGSTNSYAIGSGLEGVEYEFNVDQGWAHFWSLLTEGYMATGTPGTCSNSSSNGNGHRTNILQSEAWGGNMVKHTGMGAGSYYGPVQLEHYTTNTLHLAQDFSGNTLTEDQKNTLTSGTHYTKGSTLWFKTHYYSTDSDIRSAFLVLGDECYQLSKTSGLSDKNVVFGTSELQKDDLTNCSPYYFEALDMDGNISTFPTTGMLVYSHTDFVTPPHCDGKTWLSVPARKECIVICPKDEHQYGSSCETDSVENCGMHGYSCSEKVQGWGSGACTNSHCKLFSCADGFYMEDGECVPFDAENCGGKGLACADQIAGWASGQCVNGECVLKTCQEGMHPEVNSCVDGVLNCTDNQYALDGTCHDFDAENCGAYERTCVSQISGWQEGTCVNGICMVSKCTEGLEVSENQCGEATNSEEPGDGDDIGDEENPGGQPSNAGSSSASDDCSGNPYSGNAPVPWLMALLMGGLVGIRRRRRHN